MQNIITALQGRKTYLFATATALDGLYQYVVQHGLNVHALINYLLAGGALAAVRAAISKVPKA